MNKTTIIIALSVLFQTALYADEQHGVSHKKLPESAPKIIMPEVGSQYNLNGMQTRDGQYKSSYSTKQFDHSDKKLQNQQSSQQQKFNTNANNPGGVGVLIIVDE